MLNMQIILTFLSMVSVFATCYFIILYVEETAKEQLAWTGKKTKKKKSDEAVTGKEKSVEETIMELLDLSEDEKEIIEICEYEGKRPGLKLQIRKSFLDLTKKGTSINITHIVVISLVIFMLLSLIGANNRSAPTAALAAVVSIVYPFLLVNLLSMRRITAKQNEAQLAMITLVSTYMDAPNFDVAVRDALKIIKPGTQIHKSLTSYYNAVFNEGVGKSVAMLTLKDELNEDYYFRMFILTAIKAETSKAEYKKTLVSIPKRYGILVKENKDLSSNMTIMVAIYVIGLIVMMAAYPMATMLSEGAIQVLSQTLIGNIAQIIAFAIYIGCGFFLLANLKLVKVE